MYMYIHYMCTLFDNFLAFFFYLSMIAVGSRRSDRPSFGLREEPSGCCFKCEFYNFMITYP